MSIPLLKNSLDSVGLPRGIPPDPEFYSEAPPSNVRRSAPVACIYDISIRLFPRSIGEYYVLQYNITYVCCIYVYWDRLTNWLICVYVTCQHLITTSWLITHTHSRTLFLLTTNTLSLYLVLFSFFYSYKGVFYPVSFIM